jgi:hypothetical protein
MKDASQDTGDTRRAALLAYYIGAHADVLRGSGDNENAPGILEKYAERIVRDMDTRHGFTVKLESARARLAAHLAVYTCGVCGGTCKPKGKRAPRQTEAERIDAESSRLNSPLWRTGKG